MEKRIKIKKRIREKSWLTKTLNRIVLPVYLAFLAVLLAVLCVLLETEIDAKILFFVFIALIMLSSFSVLFIIPLCRAAQAKRDLKNYDFTPHEAASEETFTFTKDDAVYYFTPSPFDEEDCVSVLTGAEQMEDYFGQFAPDSLNQVELLGKIGEFVPFYTFDFGEKYSTVIAEKKNEPDYMSVKLTHKYELTFAEDGVRFYDRVIPYNELEGFVRTKFIQREARADVRLNVILSDTALASFAFGSRIMSIVKKHGIKITNPELAEFILRDPIRAFRLVGLKKSLDKLKPAKLQ